MYHQKYFKLSIVQEDSLDKFFEYYNQAKQVFFDTETTGLNVRHTGKDYVVGYTFAFEDEISKEVFYIPVRHVFEGKYEDKGRFKGFKESFLKLFPDFCPEKFQGTYYNVDAYDFAQRLKKVFEAGGKTYIAHNIDYDLHLFANEGIDVVKGFSVNDFDDTQIMVHTIDENVEKNLESVTKMLFKVEKSHYGDTVKTVTKDEKLSQGLKATMNASFQHVQIPIGAQYSSEDVWFMKQMYPKLIDGLKKDGQYEFYRLNRVPFIKVLWKMERQGIKIDIPALDKMQALAEKELERVRYNMISILGKEFSPDSGQQLYEILFGYDKKKIALKPEIELLYTQNAEGLPTAKKLQLKKQYLSNRDNVEFISCGNRDLIACNLGFKSVAETDGGEYGYEELKVPKTGADEIKKLSKQNVSEKAKEFLNDLKTYKKLSKLISAFMVGLRENIYEDNKIHPSFNQTGTDSYRLSSNAVNVQQLPHPLEEPKAGEDRTYYDYWSRFEIRKLFIADDGYSIIAADYHALEKFLTAHLSQDKVLIKMLTENLDPHGTVATIVFPELANANPNDVKRIAPDKRQLAKKIGFAVDYGGTSIAVAKSLECTREVAQKYIDKYFEGFYGLHTYDKAVIKFAKQHGYVRTLGGHKRHLWDINSSDMKVSSYLQRVAINVLSQGSGADVAIFAQLDVDSDPILNSIGAKTLIQVHKQHCGL